MTPEGFIAEGFDVIPPREDVLKRNREAGLKDKQAFALWLDDGIGALIDKVEELGLENRRLRRYRSRPRGVQSDRMDENHEQSHADSTLWHLYDCGRRGATGCKL